MNDLDDIVVGELISPSDPGLASCFYFKRCRSYISTSEEGLVSAAALYPGLMCR